jgi:hypothetical protein
MPGEEIPGAGKARFSELHERDDPRHEWTEYCIMVQ